MELELEVVEEESSSLTSDDFSTSDDSESSDDSLEPEERWSHESAVVDGRLYLFGGWNGAEYFNRNEIWIMNLRVGRSRRKWRRRMARGRLVPPPCEGARCIVIDKKIYSYGGEKANGSYLGLVYRLDPKKLEWIEVATPVGGKKPAPRAFCCLCAIGSRMIMFGGKSERIPSGQLQPEATQDAEGWNNEIYEFKFEEENEKGELL